MRDSAFGDGYYAHPASVRAHVEQVPRLVVGQVHSLEASEPRVVAERSDASVAFAPELLPVLLDVIDEEIDETGCTLNRVLDRPVTVERDDTDKPTALVSVYDGCERLPLTRE